MKRHSRQGFLGPGSESAIKRASAAVIGLCGGGSHVSQQLAHIGIGNISLFDHDKADETNANRMVHLTRELALNETLKTDVVGDAIQSINPDCHVRRLPGLWQEHMLDLVGCSVIFGCVDSFHVRRDLEAFARRYMIPYIDVGMDVHGSKGRYFISGQVILSMPGMPCMHCMGFLNEKVLGAEANNYGAAGRKPQVIWPNGVLASTAVGKFLALLTPWNTDLRPPLYSEYDGNRMTVEPSSKLKYLESLACPHFTSTDTGDVQW